MKLSIKVKSCAREDKIIDYEIIDNAIDNNKNRILSNNKTLSISVKAPPENNKANLAVIKLLKKHFKKPVYLISGATSRNKVVEVED